MVLYISKDDIIRCDGITIHASNSPVDSYRNPLSDQVTDPVGNW
jgi:hypothetical protein